MNFCSIKSEHASKTPSARRIHVHVLGSADDRDTEVVVVVRVVGVGALLVLRTAHGGVPAFTCGTPVPTCWGRPWVAPFLLFVFFSVCLGFLSSGLLSLRSFSGPLLPPLSFSSSTSLSPPSGPQDFIMFVNIIINSSN